MVSLACNLRDTTGFGQTKPYATGGAECAPWTSKSLLRSNTSKFDEIFDIVTEQIDLSLLWTDIGFYRPDGQHMNIAYLRHWSWSATNKRVYFAVFSTDQTEAINMVNNFFDNRGNGSPMPIEVRPTSNIPQIPPGYDPSTFDAFTYVYGDGLEYGSGASVEGRARRRVGATEQGVGYRDYTVFTVNWFGGEIVYLLFNWDTSCWLTNTFFCCIFSYLGSKLQPGFTYVNRGFYMNTVSASAILTIVFMKGKYLTLATIDL